MRHQSIPLHKIVLPARLHRVSIDEDALALLARSIAKDGLINAIAVTELGDRYQLEAGHRRFLAHQRLERTHIEAKIYEAADNANGERIRFAENLEREDLSPMEEASAIVRAINGGGMTIEEIARMVNRTPAWIHQRLALYELPNDIAEPVHARRLAIAAALALGKVEDAAHRAYLLRYTLDAGATAAVVREWVHQWLLARAAGDAGAAPRPDLPTPGQPVIIQIPCYVCNVAMVHDKLRILRVCPACTHALAQDTATQHIPT
jgi:ParB/RepB/Spo0J family partition protein